MSKPKPVPYLPEGDGQWYLAYCRPRELDRAIANLAVQGIYAWSPVVEVQKLDRQGKRIAVVEQMFPNYLFIFADLNKITPTALKSTRGISKIVHFGEIWTPLPKELVHRLMAADDSDEMRDRYRQVPKPGDSVIITEGPFKGMEAIFKEEDGDERATLFIQLLDKEVEGVFDFSHIALRPKKSKAERQQASVETNASNKSEGKVGEAATVEPNLQAKATVSNGKTIFPPPKEGEARRKARRNRKSHWRKLKEAKAKAVQIEEN